MKPNLKTFCPLPWVHLSTRSDGVGRLCCKTDESPLRDDKGQLAFWKGAINLSSYFNSEDYKKIRLQMLNGERPAKCASCFDQEDHGGHSYRKLSLHKYQNRKLIDFMIENTNPDGSIDRPRFLYLDMPLGNKCNLKCRMCNPGFSYILGKDWEKMGKPFDKGSVKKILKDKWYSSPGFFRLIRAALPFAQEFSTTGGEPLLVKEHISILEMIVEEGHADHIQLKYNTNQTIIPDRIVELWKRFKQVKVICSVEAFGKLNDYIRYPSNWRKLEKNMYYLDNLAFYNPHIEIYIHTTLQVYNVPKIPELLNWLQKANFKALFRFPDFELVWSPEWLYPGVYPQNFRNEIADNILKSLDQHEDFFLNYNDSHYDHSHHEMKVLRECAEMIRQNSSQKKHFETFIKETKAHDALRNQSVTHVLPELKPFFSDY